MRMARALGIVLVLSGMLAGCPAPGDAPFDPGTPGDTRFLDPRVVGDFAPVTLADTPPPISGGTIATVGPSASMVVVADPDRDRIMVVDLVAREVAGVASHLPPGAEPSRVAEDGSGRIHVVLRGTGEVYSFGLGAPDAGERRAVCPMPRGIAYEASTDSMLIACRGGELVTLPAAGGAATRTIRVADDLRDVVITPAGEVYVSRFRSAELLHLATDGRVLERRAPAGPSGFDPGGFEGGGAPRRDSIGSDPGAFEPGVAWRTISMPTGEVVMAHQRSTDAEVAPSPGGYGGAVSSGCGATGIVRSTLTQFRSEGIVSMPDVPFTSLPVDIAASSDGRVAMVAAGNESGQSAVLAVDIGGFFCGEAPPATTDPVPNATSVAFDGRGRLVVYSRDPSRLAIEDNGRTTWIALGGESVFDTGHAVFHGNAGRGIACASCHPEGGEDGRTWHFGGIGARRTPAMHGDLRGSEPFHWSGDMENLEHLVADVFTGRMSGPSLTGAQVDSLGNWIDELPRPVPSAPSDMAAVARGTALFWGEARCSTCHSGANLTNNATVDVGTGGPLQVPSLIGVSFRLPVMHHGCARTLEERFDPACGGGDRHGQTSQLSPEQIGELVAYLETL